MDPASQLQYIAPFLDTHLLHHLLHKNAPKESEQLREQIRAKQLGANKTEAAEVEAAALLKADKLVTLLQSSQDTEQMRREKQFTLEKLKSSRDITPEDCQNLFDYAKVLYELEKYQRKALSFLLSFSR